MTVKEFRAELGFLSDGATVVVKTKDGNFEVVSEIYCDSISSARVKGVDPDESLAVITLKK